jgi:hypothetical protein
MCVSTPTIGPVATASATATLFELLEQKGVDVPPEHRAEVAAEIAELARQEFAKLAREI